METTSILCEFEDRPGESAHAMQGLEHRGLGDDDTGWASPLAREKYPASLSSTERFLNLMN